MSKKNADELAAVKAAAWAWYQHGSGGDEGIATAEFNLRRAHLKTPRPSRYKLEAMKKNNGIDTDRLTGPSWPSPTSESSSLGLSPTHTDTSLFDSYEIGRIAKQLNSILESSHIGGHDRSGFSAAAGGYLREGSTTSKNGTIKKKLVRKREGFWLRLAIGMCTARGEVVEPTAAARPRRPNQVTVTRLDGCRPRSHA